MNQNYFQIYLLLLLFLGTTACGDIEADTSVSTSPVEVKKVDSNQLPKQFNHQNVGDLEVRIERGAFHHDIVSLEGTRIQYEVKDSRE